MKKINYLLMCAAMVAVTTFVGCNKDDEKGPAVLSPAEADAALEQMGTDVASDIQEMTTSEGVQGLNHLMTLMANDPGIFFKVQEKPDKRRIVGDKLELLKKTFTPRTALGKISGAEPFNYDQHLGVYHYNSTTGTFDYATTSDIIELHYPTEGSATNNAIFKLNDYAETAVNSTDEDGSSITYYKPTILLASLSVDDEQVVSVDLSASYTSEGALSIASIDLMVAPFTFSLDLDDANTTTSSLSASLHNGNILILSTDIVINWFSIEKEFYKKISGYIQYRKIKIEGIADFTVNSSNINDMIKLALFADGKKIGDIIFTEEMEIHVKFSNGTTKSLSEVLAPVFGELGNLYF